MNSLVYFYSKFTEEFLLLGAAGIFALLSAYCYHWVIQKRRLGIAHSQIPSAVVKSYLNQLINEAEFVRKQLFGMNNDGSTAMPIGFGANTSSAPIAADASKTAISPDLLARLGSLESQLKEKESLVVNINVEKAKLLEEIEILRANSGGTAYVEQNQKQLTDKIKNLEARLEEYALFEEDLANLKRLQQENASLKKRLSDHAPAPASGPLGSLGSDKKEQDFQAALPPQISEPSISAAPTTERKPPLAIVPEPEPVQPAAEEAPAPVAAAATEPAKHALDQSAIDALLEGKPVTPPVAKAPEAAPEAVAAPVAPAAPTKPALEAVPAGDQFEKLAESVDHSLEAEPLKAVAGDPVPTPTASGDSTLANKSDEELLKEFENLLNS
jgi:hypothetical protein